MDTNEAMVAAELDRAGARSLAAAPAPAPPGAGQDYQLYPPAVVVRNLAGPFFERRGLRLAARGLEGGEGAAAPDHAAVVAAMERNGYVRLDGLRAHSRGARDWVVVLVLAPGGRHSRSRPPFQALLAAVENERPARAGRLDELLVVAAEDFFAKKNHLELVRDAQRRQVGGADPEGATPFYGAAPYDTFATVVPDHVAVPPHRLMEAGEVAELLRWWRLGFTSLPRILATDPPVVWVGGRAGQVVEITRDSLTAVTALYYRRIVDE